MSKRAVLGKALAVVALSASQPGVSLIGSPAPVQAAEPPTFRVGIQFADRAGWSQWGTERFTGFTDGGSSPSPWAGDANRFDPDAVRINLHALPGDALGSLDFRIGGWARDNGGQYGTVRYTPWASEGGGTSRLITDGNAYDPDEYQLFLQVRSWPSSATLRDFRLSVQAHDNGVGGLTMHTPWARQNGGRSDWAVDSNRYDFDGIVIGLEASLDR